MGISLLVVWTLLVLPASAVASFSSGDQVSFTRDVAPILFENCVSCHREGGIAPFSLMAYEETLERAEQIAVVTEAGYMPPWLPEPGSQSFAGERRLSDENIDKFRQWIKDGAINGDPAELPPQPQFVEGWQLGEPDQIVTMLEPYSVPASGGDIFRSFAIPIPTEHDQFVKAMEFRPGNPRVVHHAVVLVDRTRSTRHLDAMDTEPGWEGMRSGLAESPNGHILGWTPGKLTLEVPEGMAWRLERASDLVLQLHFLPRENVEPVQVQVGFHFTSDPPSRIPLRFRLGSKKIDIPASEQQYRIRDEYRLPVDSEVIGLYPHAHYLAKEMKVWAELENGSRLNLLHIAQWDFNWQDEYRFAHPVFLSSGTILAMEFTYDNSAANPRNPNRPPQRVLYGPKSSDEMGDLWVQVVPLHEEDLQVLELDFARKETAARLDGYTFKIETNPDDEEAHYSLGGMLSELGEKDKAIYHFRESLRIRPDFAMALNNLGRLYLLDGDIEEAISLFRNAITAGPELPEAHHNLGTVLLSQGREDEAEAHFRRALRNWPDFDEAHYGLGAVLESRGQLDEALEHFRQAVLGRPDFVLAHFGLGNILATMSDDEASLRHYNAALDIQPDFVPALFNLAAVLTRKGRLEGAIRTLNRLLDIEPDHREALELLHRVESLR